MIQVPRASAVLRGLHRRGRATREGGGRTRTQPGPGHRTQPRDAPHWAEPPEGRADHNTTNLRCGASLGCSSLCSSLDSCDSVIAHASRTKIPASGPEMAFVMMEAREVNTQHVTPIQIVRTARACARTVALSRLMARATMEVQALNGVFVALVPIATTVVHELLEVKARRSAHRCHTRRRRMLRLAWRLHTSHRHAHPYWPPPPPNPRSPGPPQAQLY